MCIVMLILAKKSSRYRFYYSKLALKDAFKEALFEGFKTERYGYQALVKFFLKQTTPNHSGLKDRGSKMLSNKFINSEFISGPTTTYGGR